MSKPSTSIHPETSATPDLSLELLGRAADVLADALGLANGASARRLRSANGVLVHVPDEAMHVALTVGGGLGGVWDADAVERHLAEEARLAPAAALLRRLGDVQVRLERHLALSREAAAKGVLDLHHHLKRRAERYAEVEVQARSSRLAAAMPRATGPSTGLERRRRTKKEKPLPPAP